MTDIGAGDFGIKRWTVTRWTPQAVDVLERMWGEGASFAEMSSTLGVSVTSITSKAHVIGLPRRSTSPEWNDTAVDQLRRMWTDGDTAREIGKALGRTRSAIIGKAHRLGLEERSNRLSDADKAARVLARRMYKTQKQRVYRAPTPRRIKPPTIKETALPWAGSRNIALLDLGRNDCRFPFGDGPFVFCGQPVIPGFTYCAHCYGIAHGRFVASPCVSERGEGID